MVDVSRRAAPVRPGDPVAAALAGAGRPGGRPALITVAADGDRDEISTRTLGLWVAKTANLVVDELGLGDGDRVALRLPCHWQAWVWLLGARWAGAVVDLGEPGTSLPPDADVVVTSAQAAEGLDAGTAEVVALSLLPLAVAGPVPSHALDYDTAVRGHADRFTPTGPVGTAAPAGSGPAPRLAGRDGAARPAAGGDLVLTARLPRDARELLLLESALAAGGALLLAPGTTGRPGAGPVDTPGTAAAIAAQSPALALVGDDAEASALLPLLGV